MTTVANCADCGEAFTRDDAETWKQRCLRCWASANGIGNIVPHSAARAILADVAANLRLLMQLAHPDRHDGSDASTRATQFLLDLRRRIDAL